MRSIDYDHLHNQIMGAVQTISEDRDGDQGVAYAELINFIEDMYVNTVLALGGSILTVVKQSGDSDVIRDGMEAVKELLDTPEASIVYKINEKYKLMVTELNLPDVYDQKTNNEQVADEIKAEIEANGT